MMAVVSMNRLDHLVGMNDLSVSHPFRNIKLEIQALSWP
jgi:hypothetical protein